MLKDFVHEGIGLLILSIFLSAGIAFYFFRENQNFFSGARRLKQLTYIWLGLNGLLTISALIRTIYYIEFFALAYRRIALVFFLVAVFIGLATIAYKIYQRRNAHFIWQFNSWSVFGLLILMCGINWDVWITKYNIEHRKDTFIELSYLRSMNDKVLPFIPLEERDWAATREFHKRSLGMNEEEFSRHYEDPATFIKHIEDRKRWFIGDWEKKDWLEWNPAEYWAYSQLKP
jgi:hypothetical protein